MTIRMPAFSRLSEEQRDIFEEVPLEGASLVTGPPGTGKTVIAMYRAKALAGAGGGPVAMITHSKVLAAHSQTWKDPGFERVKVQTYHSWAHQLWRAVGGRNFAPKRNGASSEFDIDWLEITRQVRSSGSAPKLGHLVVDEGQDLPVDFYQQVGMYLQIGWVSSLSVFADENQRLQEQQNSSIAQIRSAIEITNPIVERQLTLNYRNSLPVARVAGTFYVGLQTGKPRLPADRPGQPPEFLCVPSQEAMVGRIAIHAINDPSRSLLVVCGTQSAAAQLRNQIEAELLRRGHRRIVSWYKRDHKEHGDPVRLRPGEQGVIAVVHTSSMKGLEADSVFVPGVESLDGGAAGSDVECMKLYVMTSRARSHLELHWTCASSQMVREIANRTRLYLSDDSKLGLSSRGI
jgi:superfamily I DNA and RNA helicase